MSTRFSQFTAGGLVRISDIVVGLRGGVNTQFDMSGINDLLGNTIVSFAQTMDSDPAVSYIQLINASATENAKVSAFGSETSGNLELSGYGATGHVICNGNYALVIPHGTAGEQPGALPGGLRINDTDGYLYYYNPVVADWVPVISGSAFDDATYITQTDQTANLPNSQPLAPLATGIMQVTTGTGVVSSLAVGAAGTIVRSNGTAWATSTATYPATTTINQLLYSNAANTITGLATANSAALVTTNAGVPIYSSTMTNGQVIIGSTGNTPVAATLTAGSGVTITNGAGTIQISASGSGGTVTAVTGTTDRITSTGGATPQIDIASTYVGQTSITTLGTITTGVWNGTAIPVTHGGTGLTSTTINQLLYSSANNVMAGLATANSAGLVTTSAGVPVFTSTMTNGQIIIGSTGGTPVAATLTAGTNISITNGVGSITINATGGGSTGQIVQVVSGNLTTTASTTSTSFVDTGITVTITPSSATNKVMVIGDVAGSSDNGYLCAFRLVRNSTALNPPTSPSNRIPANTSVLGTAITGNMWGASMSFLDSPATTSATTYKIQYCIVPTGGTAYINRGATDGDTTSSVRGASTITVMEVVG